MKLTYGIKAANHRFTFYHLHHKNKIVINPTQTSVGVTRPGLVVIFNLKIFKCTLIFGWQLSLTLASFFILADYSSVKLTSKTFLDLSHTAQKVEFLPDNIAILDKQLQLQITNNFCSLRYNQDTLLVRAVELYMISHKFRIKNQY